MGGILAIDPASKTGWAHKAGPAAAPEYGAAAIEGGANLGRFLANFRRWHLAIMERLEPGVVYYEPPFVGNAAAVQKLHALRGQIALNCLDRGIPCHAVAVQAWRSHFLGKGWSLRGLPKDQRRRELKAAVRRQCKILGWPAKNDDEADALGILDYACAQEKWPAAPTGLFTRGAA